MKSKDKATDKNRAKQTIIRWYLVEYDKVSRDAASAKLPFAQYVRELAVGTHIRESRSLPNSDRLILAASLGAMNSIGHKLTAIVEELELGDVPFESTFIGALEETRSALIAFEGVLDRLQKAAERTLSELETS